VLPTFSTIGCPNNTSRTMICPLTYKSKLEKSSQFEMGQPTTKSYTCPSCLVAPAPIPTATPAPIAPSSSTSLEELVRMMTLQNMEF